MKSMQRMTEVICSGCGNTFMKESSRVIKQSNKGKRHFCSLGCTNKDEFSDYRIHLARAKRRGKEINLTLQDLKEVMESQKGKCVYSGVVLTPPSGRVKDNHIYTASLDRINSSIGYVKGNVQFISIAMNYMKSYSTHEETLLLCKILAENHKS